MARVENLLELRQLVAMADQDGRGSFRVFEVASRVGGEMGELDLGTGIDKVGRLQLHAEVPQDAECKGQTVLWPLRVNLS